MRSHLKLAPLMAMAFTFMQTGTAPCFAQATTAAQLHQQQLTTARLVRAVDKFADALSRQLATNKRLPHTEAEMDQFLMDNYENVMGVPIPSQEFARPNGNVRTLFEACIWIDPRVSNLTKINNMWQFPADWSAPSAIAIVTDGAKNFVVYASIQGKPGNLYKVSQNTGVNAIAAATPCGVESTRQPDSERQSEPAQFDFGLGVKRNDNSILSPEI